MEQVTLYVIPQLAEIGPRPPKVVTVQRAQLGNASLPVGTRALIATGREGAAEAVEPYLLNVETPELDDEALSPPKLSDGVLCG